MLADVRAAPALPHDRAMHRTSTLALPYQEGLALIGDPDCGQVVGGKPRLRDRLAAEPYHRSIDLIRIVFDPSGPWEVLSYLTIRASAYPAAGIYHHHGGSCRSLIDCQHALRHDRHL